MSENKWTIVYDNAEGECSVYECECWTLEMAIKEFVGWKGLLPESIRLIIREKP